MLKLIPIIVIAFMAAVSGASAEKSVQSDAAPPALSWEQANAWIDKGVYSSDARKLGEVAAIQLDPNGRVAELFADFGGFLSFGEARVRVQPSQFRFDNDRVVLNLTADQAKFLPRIAK